MLRNDDVIGCKFGYVMEELRNSYVIRKKYDYVRGNDYVIYEIKGDYVI